MKISPASVCACSSFLTLSFGASAAVGKTFTVPFFIENINATAPSALRADFTLKKSAVLKSFSMECAGAPRGGLLYVDGGPSDVNGTTGVGATSEVGLVVGLISGLMAPIAIDFTVATDGVYFYPPTQLNLPVKQNWSFILFPNAPNSVQCNGVAVFDTNTNPDD
jgi:hypothetical protein